MGILSWLGGPGSWIGDAVKNALTGPLIDGLVTGYKARLEAGNTSEKLAADLAARELQVELREREIGLQQNIADEGRWWTAAPRALACWSFAIFIAKCVVWDTVLGLGTTPPLKGDLAIWAGWLMALWFGGRTFEKIARIIKR